MKTIGAVWMAAARQIIGKILMITAGLAAAELGLFWYWTKNPGFPQTHSGYVSLGFGSWIHQAGCYWFYGGAVLLLTIVLALQGSDFHGGKLGYTLRRLPVSETVVTGVWALLHVACYIVLWAVQVLVVLLCWWMYPSSASPALELFVAFHLDGFLHGLLPMNQTILWVRQILWIVCLGTGTAWFGMQQRRGTIAFGASMAAVFGIVTFRSAVSFGRELAVIGVMVFGLMTVYNVMRIGGRANEETN